MRSSALISIAFVAALGCGTGIPAYLDPTDAGTGSHSLTAWAINAGIVTAYEVDATGGRGASVASAPTNKDGTFNLSLSTTTNSALLIVVTGGSYVEPATGTSIRLGPGDELTALLHTRVRIAGDSLESIVVSPISHLAAVLTVFFMHSQGLGVDQAADKAWSHLNAHFGAIDWRAVMPLDLTTSTSAQLDGDARAGLLLAAISQEAMDIAINHHLTPGGEVNSLTLLQALVQDLTAEGLFNGMGPGGQLMLPASRPTDAYALDGQTVRSYLGQSAVAFLQSAQNKSHIAPADATPFLNSMAANSDSVLFSGASGTLNGPSCTFTSTFHSSSDNKDHLPVGGSLLVSGRLDLTVTCSAPAGLASITVTQGSTTLAAGTGSSLPTTFVASVDTTKLADGTLSFTATAQDIDRNTTTKQYAVVVHNAPPTFPKVTPIVAQYASGGVQVDVQAADTVAGIVSINQVGFSGLLNTDVSGSRIAGYWTFPSGTPAGPVTATVTACNGVFVCANTIAGITVDQTPPTVQMPSIAPRYYINQNTMTFTVATADGGSGVAAVYAQVGTGTAVQGTSAGGGNWTFTALQLGAANPGDNNVLLWAIDAVGNSGLNKPAPYSQSFTVTYSTTPPAIVPASMPTYHSESGMALQTSGGVPTVPAVYQYANSAKDDLGARPVPPIYKATNRLKGTASYVPTPADLEGANTFNLPFLTFSVTDSVPVATVKYSLTCTSCSSGTVYNGSALLDSSSRWLAIISSDQLPDLASATAALTLSVGVTTTDAAGNTSSTSTTLTFNVIGPPIVITEDTAYPSYVDPSGAYVYKIASSTPTNTYNYDKQFSASGVFIGNEVRVVRYQIYNPLDQPVAVYPVVSNGATWSLSETYADQIINHQQFSDKYGASYTSDDDTTLPTSAGTSCPYTSTCSSPYTPYSGNGTDGAMSQCSSSTYYYLAHPSGTTGTWQCAATAPTATTYSPQRQATGALQVQGIFSNPQRAGDETSAATPTVDAGYVIPGASGGAPGKSVLYLARPMAARNAALPSLRSESYDSAGNPVYAYQTWKQDWLDVDSAAVPSCSYTPPITGACWQCNCSGTWYPRREVNALVSATNSLNGTLSVGTKGLQPSSTPFGIQNAAWSASVTRSFSQ
jgi:hypothetical protein